DLAKSALFQRLTSSDEDERMPPMKTGKKLTATQLDLFRHWIEQGAEYRGHWAFIAPVRPPLPVAKNRSWPRNAIDNFILARMALEWLDAARYADTHGYHIDSGRDMTHWRDWVIDSFNHNQSFDQFTIEQVAGDLLPHVTVEQQVASGFNRNHMINYEGGAI